MTTNVTVRTITASVPNRDTSPSSPAGRGLGDRDRIPASRRRLWIRLLHAERRRASLFTEARTTSSQRRDRNQARDVRCVMFFRNLLYYFRKRWGWLASIGTTTHWLDFHIVLGITAPIVIAFHAAFKFRGIAGMAFWIMVAVALSGIIGRYIYALIPPLERRGTHLAGTSGRRRSR